MSAADREAVAEIVADVSNSRKQGCLYFAVCNNRLKIGSVEAALEEGLRVKGFEISRLVVAERDPDAASPSYRVLVSDPITYFANVGTAQPTLFLVHGLPELVPAETATDDSGPAPVSQRLNYGREVFQHKAVCALFWIDPETMRYLMNSSRDFWSFRSGTAQFPDTPSDVELRSGEGGWQTMAPSTRWLGDVEEKLEQLAAYRQKSPPDESAIASLLLDIGRLRVERRESQQAFEALHEAEEIFERLGNRRHTGDVKAWLSRAYQANGRLQRAEECVRSAIAIDEDLQDESSLAAAYSDLSQIYKARSQLGEAEKWLRKAIAINERLGDEAGLLVHYNNVSTIFQARGEFGEAEKWLRKAIVIAERLGDEPALANLYSNLSPIFKARGELAEAERWLRMAIAIGERLGDEANLAIRYNNLSQIYQARGELEEAEKWLRKAIAIDERLGDEPKLAIRYNNLSRIYQDRGELREAEKWLRKAIAIDERLGNEPALAILDNNLSQIYEARGELGEAEKWLRKALALAKVRGTAETLATVRSNLKALLQKKATNQKQVESVPYVFSFPLFCVQ